MNDFEYYVMQQVYRYLVDMAVYNLVPDDWMGMHDNATSMLEAAIKKHQQKKRESNGK